MHVKWNVNDEVALHWTWLVVVWVTVFEQVLTLHGKIICSANLFTMHIYAALARAAPGL